MIKLLRTIFCIGVFSVGLIATANANLEARPGGMVYDDVLNITWLADANYAQTSGYDSDGRMNFSEANTWAAGLSYGGYDDWRLPTALNQDGSGPCSGLNCTSSEMGHMFYNIRESWIYTGTNLTLFTHLQFGGYWFGTVDALNPSRAFVFGTPDNFLQYISSQENEFYAWAVRDGDVAAISEPETYAMLLAGLLAMFGFGRLRQKS